MRTEPAASTFRRWVIEGGRLPRPAGGATAERFAALRARSSAGGGFGRLVEAHEDAVAILQEAGMEVPVGAALAVWASEGPQPVELRTVDGRHELWGTKRFCGGAALVDAALVTVEIEGRSQLVLARMEPEFLDIDASSWRTPAFADAAVATVTFRGLPVADGDMVGEPGFYTARPGFWQGAAGIAAVWAGLADALVSLMAARRRRDDQVADAHWGRIAAARWSVDAALEHAARQIDAAPNGDAMRVALSCRHTVRAQIEVIVGAVMHEAGPAGLAFDDTVGTLLLEISMALGQGHGERDLAGLGGAS